MIRYIVKTYDFFRYDIPYGVKNLFRWFKIIWKDRNWDNQYIYSILHHKLNLQERHIRKHDNHTDAQKIARKMRLCVLLLERLMKDDYNDLAFYFHNKKWGEPEFNLIDVDDEYKKLDITHENVNTKEEEEQHFKEYKRCSEHEDMLREQDLDMLFKLMRKHIQTWWD